MRYWHRRGKARTWSKTSRSVQQWRFWKKEWKWRVGSRESSGAAFVIGISSFLIPFFRVNNTNSLYLNLPRWTFVDSLTFTQKHRYAGTLTNTHTRVQFHAWIHVESLLIHKPSKDSPPPALFSCREIEGDPQSLSLKWCNFGCGIIPDNQMLRSKAPVTNSFLQIGHRPTRNNSLQITWRPTVEKKTISLGKSARNCKL